MTVVLIGLETSQRKWVRYEIEESLKRRNGILAVYINGIRDLQGRTDLRGQNPFDLVNVRDSYGRIGPLTTFAPAYDWVLNDGYRNLGAWIESAAQTAGR